MSGDGPRRPCLWAEKPWLGRSEVMEITCLFGCGNKVNVKEVVWEILNGVWRFYEDSICQYVFFNQFLITSASVRKRSAINSWIRLRLFEVGLEDPGCTKGWVIQVVQKRWKQRVLHVAYLVAIFQVVKLFEGVVFSVWLSCWSSLYTHEHTHCWERWVLLNDVRRQP